MASWVGTGDVKAGEHLAEAVYPELQKIAARFLNNERAGHTLEPNALVHELWMGLVGNDAIPFRTGRTSGRSRLRRCGES